MICLHVILHAIKKMPTLEKNNASKFSKCEPHHKHKQKHQDIAQHKPSLKGLHNVYTLLVMNNSMDNYNMAMLSMEPRKLTIIVHNNYCLPLIQSTIGLYLTLEML